MGTARIAASLIVIVSCLVTYDCQLHAQDSTSTSTRRRPASQNGETRTTLQPGIKIDDPSVWPPARVTGAKTTVLAERTYIGHQYSTRRQTAPALSATPASLPVRPQQFASPIRSDIENQPNQISQTQRQVPVADPAVPASNRRPGRPIRQTNQLPELVDSRPGLPSGGGSPAPGQPPKAQPKLNMDDVLGIKFADAKGFLIENSGSFADPNRFLNKPSPPRKRSLKKLPRSRTPSVVSASAANPGANTQDSVLSPSQNMNFSDPQTGVDDEAQYLTVSDVYAPIGMLPFADLKQQEGELDLIPEGSAVARPTLRVDSYSELTGQYFQPHIATWSAHQFRHRPLYFEEVNLERYGNELRFQRVASAAHFFVSTALLPYKMGQNPCKSCITTLGHQRPGDCVPYQYHGAPLSRKGLFWQALATTAIAL